MIAMNDFAGEPAELRAAMLVGVERVLASGWYVLGREVERFEQAWAERCGCRYGVGTGNGMDAIEVGLRALGIGPGDEVVTTSMTAFASVLAILRAGATPVLADIDPDTALLDLDSVARCLSPRTRAVILVHLYGQMPPMEPWVAFCERRGIALVEDCAQAHLAQWNGQPAGSFGRFGAYSFYPTKNLGTAGDGGMLVCNDEALARKAAQLRNYGQSVRYHHPEIGLNSRLDEVHAAMLLERLAWLDRFTARRREVAAFYQRGISHPAVSLLPAPRDPASHVHHLYVLRCERRDALAEHLKAQGVASLIHYPVPVHRQPPCADVACDPAGMRATERHAATCLSLPCHPGLTDDALQRVVDAVNGFQSG